MLLGVGCVSASTLVVSKTSSACTTGDVGYGSIQAAVDNANGGDEIVVCPGTYVENVEVDKSVDICSYAGSRDTIIEAKNSANNVINITANKVNISGFNIKNSEAAGIYQEYADGCNLSENNIYSTSDGIHLFSSNNSKICYNTVNSNYFTGIRLRFSNDNLIANNIAKSNKNLLGVLGYGLMLFGSNNNTVIDNNVSENVKDGISLFGSSNNIIKGNTANSNKKDGIELFFFSDNNSVIENSASDNFKNGIALDGSSKNVIRANKAFDNSVGIKLQSLLNFSSVNNTIITNNASNNMDCGIALNYSDKNIIKDNTVTSNKRLHGILLMSSNNNDIIANNASNNMQAGIFLSDSSNNNIKDNTANSNNYNGIYQEESNNNDIIDNNFSNNVQNGVWLDHSNNNSIKGNIPNSNSYGIHLSFSDNNNIVENNVSNNTQDGISLHVSRYNSIKGNTVIHNYQGIAVILSYGNDVTNNFIYLNYGGGIRIESVSFTNNISNNIINSNAVYGLLLADGSVNNNIESNIINSNKGTGLSIQSSENNTVLNNVIDINRENGITFYDASAIIISGNTISTNYCAGITFARINNSYNKIHHNNIINNIANSKLNSWWYDLLLKEGNYWSNYDGVDDGSGTGKHCIAGDGIGDTDIPHPGAGGDYYPFMNRDGWLTMSLWPHYFDFGKVYQGTLINQTFTITNYGNSKLTIYSIKSDQIITTSGIELPAEISKGHSLSFNMSLNTEELGGFVLKNIEIISNDIENSDKNISIFGFVEIPTHDIEIRSVDYQSRIIKSQINLFNVSINNTGDFREKNVCIEFKQGDISLGNTTITNIGSKETKSAIFKWDTADVAPRTYDILIEVKLKDKPLSLATLQVPVKVDMPSTAQTLILTNKEKLVKYWGAERAEKLENELIKLSYHVGVAGITVYVEEDEAVASAYESWDLNLHNPQEANKVSKHIKKLIDKKLKEYTGIKYVIIVGDDRVIPYYRIHDNTDKPFRPELWQTGDDYHKVNIDSTIGSALRNKMFLTDNIYATDRSMEWKTADVIIPELFVPDVPLGRLVESPEDISAVIAAFYQKEYVNPDKIFVTGYDFMSDSASDCSSTLENRTKGNITSIISQKKIAEKYFDDIKDELLNTSNNIVFVFQHAEHDLFNIPKYRVGSENITSQNISTLAAGLNGSIVCSLGCHSGLNVPPNASPDDFDLAQAFAQKGVLAYLAPTSYSIGLQRTIGAHELLISYFTQYLCAGMDVGTALTRAKQEYWATNYDISYIDEQVLETTTLYGLPMARINIPRLNTPYNESRMKIMSFEQGKPDILVICPTYSRINISTILTLPITYYKSKSGELFLEPNAPVQPKEIRVFYPTPTRMLHGAVLTSAKYTVKSIIPLIDAYMQSPVWIGKSGSPVIEDWCPAQIFKLKSLCYPRAPTESRQYLIIVTGQYKGPTRVTPSLVGRKERLYDELSFQLYYASPDAETKPPVINVSHRINHNVTISVNASDESGIQRVLVTYTDGKSEWESKDLKKAAELWTCSIPLNEISEFFVQAVDKNGNVAVGKVFF